MRPSLQDKANKPRTKILPALLVVLSLLCSFVYLTNYVQIRQAFSPTCGPFFIAADAGDVSRMSQLLQKDTGLLDRPCVYRDKEQDGIARLLTPLQNAALKGSLRGVIFLVENGATVDRTTSDVPHTPLGLSISRNDDIQIAEYLVRHGADIKGHSTAFLQEAVDMQAIKTMQLMLRHGADVNVKDATRLNSSPLAIVICQEKNTDAVKLLLQRGADVNTQDTYGDTPLHLATEFGKAGNVSQLLAAGASCNTQDASGMTPLHYAVRSVTPDAPAIAALLKSAGARFDIKDNNEQTALDLARELRKPKLIKVLESS